MAIPNHKFRDVTVNVHSDDDSLPSNIFHSILHRYTEKLLKQGSNSLLNKKKFAVMLGLVSPQDVTAW